jgi:hypothetical protein
MEDYDTNGFTVTLSLIAYSEIKEKADGYDKWIANAQWETDNHGQVLIYTGLDSEGNPIDLED